MSAFLALARSEDRDTIGMLAAFLVFAVYLLTIVRFGLLPTVVGFLVSQTLVTIPVAADFQQWYATSSAFVLVLALGIDGYGLFCNLSSPGIQTIRGRNVQSP